MKYLFTCLFLVSLFVSKVNAQTWCPPGATWNYTISTIFPTVVGYQQVRYIDTIRLNGKLCQKLQSRNYETWVSWGNSHQESGFTFYTHLENGILSYQSAPNRFDTIADFNARPGAHWYAYAYQGTTYTPTYIPRMVVKDTGHAVVNGVNLKYLQVGFGDSLSVFSASFTPYLHRIYERMGDVSQFMYMVCPQNFPDWRDGNGNFSCYWDDTFPIYSLPGMKCNYNTVGIKEVAADKGTLFYPNPSNGLFTVHAEADCQFFVYSATGDLVKTIPWNASSMVFDLSDLPNGIYFVKSSEPKSMPFQKLVKN